jgi:molybdopterin converting factor subunit 1
MRVSVLLFASVKDAVGKRSLTLALRTGVTVAEARAVLAEQYPAGAAPLRVAIAAVNREFAEETQVLSHGDELAFFPPVSGGQGWPEVFLLAPAPYSTDALMQAVSTEETGALCVFTGKVRGQTHSAEGVARTSWLEYEAYEAMALDKMRQVAGEIRQQWPRVQGIAIVQRVGRLDVGENTIMIACAAAHRDHGCFEAARYGIDRLKEIVPVWKREVGPGAAGWVEGAYRPDAADRGAG